ncbi:MAG: hypothetical protein KAX84_07655 [Burkholderiales bacterium]|nr:hypothetical protein [Burkholderiales bacterium]
MGSKEITPRMRALDDGIVAIFRSGCGDLTAEQVRIRLGGMYDIGEVKRKLNQIAARGDLRRTLSLYGLPAPVLIREPFAWRALQPARCPIVPVRAGGRMAPDIGCGPAVCMTSRVSISRGVSDAR